MKLLTAFLLVLSSVVAFAASPIALVYVPTSNGINVYDASSAGKLTTIAGSPFKQTSGLFIGTNGKYVITLGTDYVHSYEVSSTGAIGKQVSEINTQAYSGAACSTTNGAVLDHSGQYIYVNFCSALQTYEISPKGILTFKGATVLSAEYHYLPLVAGNDKFALSLNISTGCGGWVYSINSFARESTGLLELGASTEKDPLLSPQSGFEYYTPIALTEDPTNHYAVALVQTNPCENSDGSDAAVQIGSYTGSSAGLSSTNTWENMPTIFNDGFSSDGSLSINGMRMNPAGNILAVATSGSDGDGEENYEFLYHFKGAAPVTNFTNFSIPGPVDDEGTAVYSMAWDTSNHLYLLCNSWDGVLTLSVYTVTTTSVKLVDTYTLGSLPSSGLGSMVVRSL